MSLQLKLQESSLMQPLDSKLDEAAVQQQAAPALRQAAIQHLRYGQGVVAKSFRGEYLASGLGSYEVFLQEQSRNGAWGTYLEAAALGELLDCHVIVTPIKDGRQQNPICLYRSSNDKAPTIPLYNSNNTHWFTNNKTAGDGNCLFNAFAQALQKKTREELQTGKPASTSQLGHFASSFKSEAVISHQQAIHAAILKQPTPQELEQQLIQEKERISRLSPAEQEQIAQDYQLALSLAWEEKSLTALQPSLNFATEIPNQPKFG